MAAVAGYNAFDGLHWETGSVRNALAGMGVIAPHTGSPPSEALMLGLSGGVALGYFVFEYKGYDPQMVILTRSTFDPLAALFKRLGIKAQVKETVTPAKAVRNVVSALDEGIPPLVFADIGALPYNAVVLPESDGHAIMNPLVVFSWTDDAVQIADRARVPLMVTPDELAVARKRGAAVKNRVIVLAKPDFDALPSAVEDGIRAALALYTDAPPKGAKDNFGLAALHKWANLLVDETDKRGWAQVFPRGRALYAGLLGAFVFIETWGTEGAGSRGMYADFLDEAADILSRPALHEAAARYREAIPAWRALAAGLLPDQVEPLRQTRALLMRSYGLFLERGGAALVERLAIREQVAALKAEMLADFPMNDGEVAALRAELRERVLHVAEAEAAAVSALQAAMA
jgi:hypothetical protein